MLSPRAPVATNQLQAGDLLFYAGTDGAGAIGHVAMYIGDGRMIEAFDAATPVRITAARLDGGYRGAVRYLPV
ncbi:MAG: C40 family peptidase [Pseudonocardia sp.]|nr:C40 family peptidase [Pseudonocardia sp.]